MPQRPPVLPKNFFSPPVLLHAKRGSPISKVPRQRRSFPRCAANLPPTRRSGQSSRESKNFRRANRLRQFVAQSPNAFPPANRRVRPSRKLHPQFLRRNVKSVFRARRFRAALLKSKC